MGVKDSYENLNRKSIFDENLDISDQNQLLATVSNPNGERGKKVTPARGTGFEPAKTLGVYSVFSRTHYRSATPARKSIYAFKLIYVLTLGVCLAVRQ